MLRIVNNLVSCLNGLVDIFARVNKASLAAFLTATASLWPRSIAPTRATRSWRTVVGRSCLLFSSVDIAHSASFSEIVSIYSQANSEIDPGAHVGV